jgi:hypothetical protein
MCAGPSFSYTWPVFEIEVFSELTLSEQRKPIQHGRQALAGYSPAGLSEGIP